MKPGPDFLIASEFYIFSNSQLDLLIRLQILCQNYASTVEKRVTPKQQGLQCEPCGSWKILIPLILLLQCTH